MKNFIGTYECKIDDKGRLKVPSSLIKQMENFDDKAFVVKRSVFQTCLEVYPMNAWDKVMGKINKKKLLQFEEAFSIAKFIFYTSESNALLITKFS